MSNFVRLTFLACILLTLTACATVSAATQDEPTAAPSTPVPTVAPSPTSEPPTAVSFACQVTSTIMGEPPKDPNSDPFGYGPWMVNADQTMWAGWDPTGWTASSDGNKTVWIRPQGTTLHITGNRLDGDSAPLKADIPCCYTTGFQIVGLYFPSAGCWQVKATSGQSQLQFTLQVAQG